MPSADSSALTVEATRAYRRTVAATAATLREESTVPPVGLVLSSAIGRLDAFTLRTAWRKTELPYWPEDDAPEDTVLLEGRLAGTPVLMVPEAFTLHEGYPPRDIAFPLRVLGEAGVDTILFANTATSVVPEMGPSALVLASDHINFQGTNPLMGPNVEAWGPRFPDMTQSYAPELRRTAHDIGLREGISVSEGVYLALVGPGPHTRAEHRMGQRLGADLVGTETVQEVIAARHMDLRVLSVSVVTERAAMASAGPTDEDRVEAVRRARPQLQTLLAGIAAGVKSKEKSGEQKE